MLLVVAVRRDRTVSSPYCRMRPPTVDWPQPKRFAIRSWLQPASTRRANSSLSIWTRSPFLIVLRPYFDSRWVIVLSLLPTSAAI
jgi:hypothetical protein